MKPACRLLCALVLTTLAACSLVRPPPALARASAVPLLDTHWRLSQIGGEVIDNPVGERAVSVSLTASNSAVTGNSGCNRMSGRYALEGDMLKFDALVATKMYCESRMQLEQSFTNALLSVIRWRITGQTLELFDETGKPVATFTAP
jgi:heat shock protein HslJ